MLKIKIEQGRLPRFQAVDLDQMEVVQKLGMVVTANTIIFIPEKGASIHCKFCSLRLSLCSKAPTYCSPISIYFVLDLSYSTSPWNKARCRWRWVFSFLGWPE